MAIGDAVKRQGTESFLELHLSGVSSILVRRESTPQEAQSGSEAEDTKAGDIWELPIAYDESLDTYPDSLEISTITSAPSTISIIFPSLLPASYFSDTISVTSGMSYASSTFDTLTYHRELREAQLDSDFDRILIKLLLSIAAVDTTVFGFSSGNLFSVDSVAKRALIISTIAAAIGLFVDVWFILAYSGADVRKFQTLAIDLYGSYFFFALSSRLPLVALFVAVLALVIFLGAIAWTTWPATVLVMCVLAGLLVSLQFIVYGCHRLALGLAPVRHVVASPASARAPGPARHTV
ncbi:hypothetical protein H4582DRAFT_2084046 [Lactarius indigo]|nr:hypothetical protein H4582DRAFT_2084046 [Lactarius indigo]